MGHQASWVSEGEAERCIAGVGVGIDVTARDLQEKAKAKALPWAIAKGFDSFAVLGAFGRPEGNLGDCTLQLSVNGEIRQHGRTADMLFSVPRLISFLSSVFTLYPGDLIFTGTPPGVAPLHEGDRVQASLLHANSGTILSTLETTVRTHSGRPESKGRESEDMSDERV